MRSTVPDWVSFIYNLSFSLSLSLSLSLSFFFFLSLLLLLLFFLRAVKGATVNGMMQTREWESSNTIQVSNKKKKKSGESSMNNNSTYKAEDTSREFLKPVVALFPYH